MTKIYIATERRDGLAAYSIINEKNDFLCGIIRNTKKELMPMIIHQFLIMRGNEQSCIYFDEKDRDLFNILSSYLVDPQQLITETNSTAWRLFDNYFLYSLIHCELGAHQTIDRMRSYAKSLIDRALVI